MARQIPETPPDYDQTRVIERPDGYYWQSIDGGKEYGPFQTLIEAVQDMQAVQDTGFEPGESVEEAEDELGVSSWIDPETGEPAEDGVHRFEDH